jgi:hypothetical protein
MEAAIEHKTLWCQEFIPENLQFAEINVKGFVERRWQKRRAHG